MSRTGQQMRQRTTAAMGNGPARHTQVHGQGRGARLRYWFDNSMSRGTSALIAWLALINLLLILGFTVFVAIFGLADDGTDFGHQLLRSLFHALDPGTVTADTGSWRFVLVMLALTVAGLLIVSALIGVIATGIDAKLSDLRRGRSVVIERDHTVILGWSDSVFTILERARRCQ